MKNTCSLLMFILITISLLQIGCNDSRKNKPPKVEETVEITYKTEQECIKENKIKTIKTYSPAYQYGKVNTNVSPVSIRMFDKEGRCNYAYYVSSTKGGKPLEYIYQYEDFENGYTMKSFKKNNNEILSIKKVYYNGCDTIKSFDRNGMTKNLQIICQDNYQRDTLKIEKHYFDDVINKTEYNYEANNLVKEIFYINDKMEHYWERDLTETFLIEKKKNKYDDLLISNMIEYDSLGNETSNSHYNSKYGSSIIYKNKKDDCFTYKSIMCREDGEPISVTFLKIEYYE